MTVLKIADLWKLEVGKDKAVVNKCHIYSYTKDDEGQIAILRARGDYANQLILQYVNGMGGHDPNGPGIYVDGQLNLAPGTAVLTGVVYKDNNVYWNDPDEDPNEEGIPDVVKVRDDIAPFSRAFGLTYPAGHAQAGQFIRSDPDTFPNNWYHNFSLAAVINFIKSRLDSWTFPGAVDNDENYDGVSGDNFDTWFDAQGNEPVETAEFGEGDGNTYWQALLVYGETMKDYAETKTGEQGLPGIWLWNMQGFRRDATSAARWVEGHVKSNGDRRVHAGLIEGGIIQSNDTLPTTAQWNREIDGLEKVLAAGVDIWHLIRYVDPTEVNSNPTGAAAIRTEYALASYLLVCAPQGHERVGDEYGTLIWLDLYDEINAGLGHPLGKRYSTGSNIWRRDFYGGHVIVNVAAKTYSINYTTPTGDEPPFVNQPVNISNETGVEAIRYFIVEPVAGGAITPTESNLPPGIALTDVTGTVPTSDPAFKVYKLSGEPTTPGIYNPEIEFAETGGGAITVDFTWTITGEATGGGEEPEEGALILGLNFGGTLQTMASGDVFQEAGIAATPVGYTLTAANATTDGTNLATLIRDVSIPDDWTDTLFQSHWNDATNPAAVVSIPTSVPVTIKLGFNSGGTPAGRVVEPFFNGVSSGMAINFADYAANTGFVVTFENIAPVGGNITIEVCRHATATVSSRVMVGQVREYVAPNEAPVLNPIGNQTVNENEELEFTVTATDAEGTPTITYTTLPTGMEVSGTDASKTFTWIPGYGDSGEYTVQFTATDDADATASETITITVNNIDPVPVLDSIGDKTVSEGAALTFTAVATIADETPPLYSGTGSAFDNGATIDPSTGAFTWTPDDASGSPYEAVIIATNPNDESKFASETISITVTEAAEDTPVRPRWKRMPPIAIRVARTRRRRRRR